MTRLHFMQLASARGGFIYGSSATAVLQRRLLLKLLPSVVLGVYVVDIYFKGYPPWTCSSEAARHRLGSGTGSPADLQAVAEAKHSAATAMQGAWSFNRRLQQTTTANCKLDFRSPCLSTKNRRCLF